MSAPSLPDALRQRIEAEGPMRLDMFWREAMTAPGLGYYSVAEPIGRKGDFTTASEVSQIFGELVGLWLAEAWRAAGEPAQFTLIELGPGRGLLMADALRAAANVPGFREAMRLVLVDRSGPLKAEQAARLADARPVWRDDLTAALEAADGDPVFLIANEFVDALPVRQFVHYETGWEERFVTVSQEGGFVFETQPAPLPADVDLAEYGVAETGAVLEIAPERAAIAANIARRISDADGAALFIDYGYRERQFGDSLQALTNGAPTDPLADPGGADITAHVDFTALRHAAEKAGARAWGPVDQGAFLLRLGAEPRAGKLAERAAPEAQAEIAAALRRLVHPMEMGELFKAMALLPAVYFPPAGFEE